MKSGYLFLTMVLLVVFAIPLSAGQPLGKTVGEFSTISTINSEEDKNQGVSAPVFEIVALKPDEIVLPQPEEVEVLLTGGRSAGKSFLMKVQKQYGGERRIKSGRH